MPLTTIPPIDNLPSVSDTQEDFSAKAFNAWPQLNATAAAINALASELNALASTVDSQTSTVQTAQDAVLAAANYAGEWSGLTGALSVPASTTHDGHFWILTAPVADVTAEEPTDESLVWTRVVSDAADFLYDGAAVGLAATNVAAALGELALLSRAGLRTFRNRVVNGSMRSAQMLHPIGGPGIFPLVTSFPVPSNSSAHTLDTWKVFVAGSGSLTVTQGTFATDDDPFAKWLVATVTAADGAMAAGDYATINQNIEGYEISDLIGEDFSVSFCVRSPVTGLHSVALRNELYDLSYVFTFDVVAADTPQKVSLSVLGGLPASGTWNLGSGTGLRLGFCFAGGSNFEEANTEQWVSADRFCGVGQVNCMATVGNVFAITEVQLERGPVATPFERLPLPVEMDRVKRQFEVTRYSMMEETWNGGNGSLWHCGYYKQTKRAIPTLGVYAPAVAGGSTLTLPTFDSSYDYFRQTSVGAWNEWGGGTSPLTLYIFADATLN